MPSISLPAALGISAVAGLGGAALQSGAASSAAQTQATAAQSAAQQQAASQQQAINAQLQMFGVQQQDLAPYNAAGQNALAALQYGVGISPQSTAPAASASPAPAASAASSGQSVWDTVLQQRPDVLAEYNSLPVTGNTPYATQSYFGNSAENYAQQWYQMFGQNQGYQLPAASSPASTAPPAAAAPTAYAPPQQSAAGGGAVGSTMPALLNGSPLTASAGTTAFGGLNPASLGPVPQAPTIPQFNWSPTQAQLAQTPGYQFTLNQGLNQLNNQASATGGALGGNQLKAIQQYAQGLAGTTYQQQYGDAFQQYQQQVANTQTGYADQMGSYQQGLASQQQAYNQLAALVQGGQSSAAGVGAGALSTGQSIGANLGNIGSALAGGTIGAANANSAGTIAGANAFSNIGSSVGQNFLTAALLGQNGGLGTINAGYAAATPEFY